VPQPPAHEQYPDDPNSLWNSGRREEVRADDPAWDDQARR